VNNSTRTGLSQPLRLIILLVYVGGLVAASKFALGTWMPPTSERGVWFYSALAALLLGNLIVSPFFTKPADAIAYSVAALIALLSTNAWSATGITNFDRFLWTIAHVYVCVVLISGILCIVAKNLSTNFAHRFSQTFFAISDALGNPRAIFSIVFIFALVAFHRNNPVEYLVIGAAWVIFVGMRPLEGLVELSIRLFRLWSNVGTVERFGEVVGHEYPGIVLIRENTNQKAEFGELLIARFADDVPAYAVALDHIGYSEGCWLRAMKLTGVGTPKTGTAMDNSVYRISNSDLQANVKTLSTDMISQLLGIVAPDTTVGGLSVEIIRSDLDLYQGSLLRVAIGRDSVLYQVMDGITREEILQQKNTRGFIRAQAKKIGVWNDTRTCFDPVSWLPQPNESVHLVKQGQPPADKRVVGHFPGTQYQVRADVHTLVTHNAAILGILGVGKTFLALELVERMIDSKIRVICLDLTNQYAKELAAFYDEAKALTEIDELNKIGAAGKTNVKKNVEEGGSINEFRTKIKECIASFLAVGGQEMLRIYNPTKFEVWRQDSKPYQDQASMASLTPCEITRIISEAVLEVLQNQGMSEAAKCCLVYEEAHSLVPEWSAAAAEGDKTATNGTAKAILQGRKFGLGCMVITQRTANVTKSILNQCNTVFALRVFDATGIEFLSNYIGNDYAGVLSNLEDRHAVVFGRASSCKDPVLVRLNDRDQFLKVFRDKRDKES
jgi:hypothetical protein